MAPTFAAGTNPVSIATADFNGDGKADLAVGKEATVAILLGDGTGHFGAPVDYPVGSNAVWVAVADFNGDGNPDLAVANQGSNSVSILLGTGSGTFGAPMNLGAGA